ncbi:MAG: hypothetical protein WB772_21075, partial [Xanthobacteraceae bacterium]
MNCPVGPSGAMSHWREVTVPPASERSDSKSLRRRDRECSITPQSSTHRDQGEFAACGSISG